MKRVQAISEIGAKHLKIGTLEAQKCDSVDFHEVGVWSVREALGAAYDAGQASAASSQTNEPQEDRRRLDADDDE